MFTSTKGPARPTPPGRIIQRELDERGWTQNDLAAVMGRPAQAISEIVTGKKQITAETALELGEAFGVDAAFWSSLQSTYNLHQARQQRTKHEVARRSQLYSVTPLADLIKRRWVDVTRKSPIERQEAAVCRFSGFPTLAHRPSWRSAFVLPNTGGRTGPRRWLGPSVSRRWPHRWWGSFLRFARRH